jgi:hypothetical protein
MPTRPVVASVTHRCTLEMGEPCSFTVTAKYFFIHHPQIAVGHVAVMGPREWGGRIQSRGTPSSFRALPSREAGSRVVGHMAAPEPSHVGRRGPESLDAWRH